MEVIEHLLQFAEVGYHMEAARTDSTNLVGDHAAGSCA